MDEASRKTLEALGRTLPKPLPLPRPAAKRKGADPRHPIETSQDPRQLFHELMGASPDGTVPPHLLQRLRDLEQQQQRAESTGSPLPGNASEQELYLQFQQLLEDSEQQ